MSPKNISSIAAVALLVIALVLYISGIQNIYGLPLLGADQFASGFLAAGNFSIGIFSFGIYASGIYVAKKYIESRRNE